jgi:poly(3-hydroxybutyrate) depolymerase
VVTVDNIIHTLHQGSAFGGIMKFGSSLSSAQPVVVAAALLMVAGCSNTPYETAAGSGAASAAEATNEVRWECPDGYEVKAGLNTDFPHKGQKRAFVVYPPENAEGPAPVWVPMTGTVESTMDNLTVQRSGANALLAKHGYMVIGPVRQCANQDPNARPAACNGPGKDGWNWAPWNEGRAANASGDRWKTDEGADSSFLVAMVKCVGTKFELDPRRLYLGGISSGGTMTNRALLFRSDFWAGGLPISGEWYVSADDGTPLSFDDARAAVAAAPTKIHQGRVGPYPLPSKLGPMIVMTVWGGENDLWNCTRPDGSKFLCADYRPSTQAGSNYFSAHSNVVHVACTANHGHMWPQVNTSEFNLWALNTLASHPKGSDPRDFKLTQPPEGYSCRVGPFVGLY